MRKKDLAKFIKDVTGISLEEISVLAVGSSEAQHLAVGALEDFLLAARQDRVYGICSLYIFTNTLKKDLDPKLLQLAYARVVKKFKPRNFPYQATKTPHPTIPSSPSKAQASFLADRTPRFAPHNIKPR